MDDRRAEIEFSADGARVEGVVRISSICRSNMRLGGATMRFTGELQGPWEGPSSYIEAHWSGDDHNCGVDVPNNGRFRFFRKEEAGMAPILHLRVDGQRGRYGYDFPPKNRVLIGGPGKGGGGEAVVAMGEGFESPLGRPGSNYRTGAPPPTRAAPRNFDPDLLRRHFAIGTIALQVGESRFQHAPQAPQSRKSLRDDGSIVVRRVDCVVLAQRFVEVRPASLASAEWVGNGVRVRARAKGKGEIWMTTRLRCKDLDSGRSETAVAVGVYYLLVGDEAVEEYRKSQGKGGLPPAPLPDVSSVEVRGVARMRNRSEGPVGGAMISLVRQEGGVFQRDSWRTKPDGSFAITARDMLLEGTYEVLVQKLGQDPSGCNAPDNGAPPGVGVACDLWPVRKHMVKIGRGAKRVESGVIEMDYAHRIDFSKRR